MVNVSDVDHSPEMVMVFIDGPRFDRMIHALGVEIDYEKLIQFLSLKRELAGVIYFHHPANINKDLRSKLTALNVQIIEDVNQQTLNKKIIFEIRSRRRELNHIVLVSGNSSFTSIIESSVVSYGCTASIFCIKEQLYASYKSLPVEIIDLRENLNEIGFHEGDPEEAKIIEASGGAPRERVVILIDAANIMAVLRRKKIVIDFYALRRTLSNGRETIGTYYYHGTPAPPQNFANYLKKVGYTLVQGKNTNIDPIIINRIQKFAEEGQVDTIIVVAGDGDYLTTIEKVIDDHKIKVELVSFDESLFDTYFTMQAMQGLKLTLLDDILDRITRNRPEDGNGGEPLLPEIISADVILPEKEVVMPEESPVPKPKRRTPTKAELFVSSAKYFLTDGSIEGIRVDMVVKGKKIVLDIREKRPKK